MSFLRWATACAVALASVSTMGACSKHRSTLDERSVIRIDGSSTVYPVSEAAAEEFQKQYPAHITIGVSGTGGGFKRFCAGEVALVGASRPIKTSEQQHCHAAAIEFVELPLAYDGIAVVVHPQNTWASSLTVADLKKIWQPDAQHTLLSWNQVRPEWPALPLSLFGPGVDSGTYDYFTKAIVGQEHYSRGDYTSSEDDNVLVRGVSREHGALGFFGLAYFEANADKLKLVAIDDQNDANGAGAIHPTQTTIKDGTYQPLSRPMFLYVNKAALARREVDAFVEFYLAHVVNFVEEAQYVPLPARAYELTHQRFRKAITGSMLSGQGSEVGVNVEALLARP
jgi:phosphate transport system substrate-binding protein